MTTIEALEKLERAGFPQDQARAIVASIDDQAAGRLATKADLAKLRADNMLLKWMVGFDLGLTAAILWKLL